MSRRRARARENPTPLVWAAVALGAVAVGGVVYAMTRKPAAVTASTLPAASSAGSSWVEIPLTAGHQYVLPSNIQVATTVTNPTATVGPFITGGILSDPAIDKTTVRFMQPGTAPPAGWPPDGGSTNAFRAQFTTTSGSTPFVPGTMMVAYPGQRLWVSVVAGSTDSGGDDSGNDGSSSASLADQAQAAVTSAQNAVSSAQNAASSATSVLNNAGNQASATLSNTEDTFSSNTGGDDNSDDDGS
jgi:hypothetical protein